MGCHNEKKARLYMRRTTIEKLKTLAWGTMVLAVVPTAVLLIQIIIGGVSWS